MKCLFSALLLLVPLTSVAQTPSPTCPTSLRAHWTNCISSISYNDGTKLIREWKENKQYGYGLLIYKSGYYFIGSLNFLTSDSIPKPDGEGIEYRADGSFNRSGAWSDGTLFKAYELQGGSYPFNLGHEAVKAESDPKRQQASETHFYQAMSEKEEMSSSSNVALPLCPETRPYYYWHGCVGSITWPNGNRYSGEFMDGKFNGQGTEYSSNGAIIKSGIWRNGSLFNSSTTTKYAFNIHDQIITNLEVALIRQQEIKESNFDAALKRQQELEEQLALEKAERQRLVAQLVAQNTQQVTAQSPQINRNDRRLALVIGNGAYKVRPLNNPVNDANDISATLKRSGFQVIDVRNANLTQMRAKIREFGDQLINSDVGLVYYSGHGVELKGRNYLIPVNADIQREDEIADQGLDAGLILEKMNTAGKGVNILVVDACRDDPFGRSFRSTGRGLAQMDAPKGTIIAYSTSPGKVASDGDPKDRNSPYTKHLLRAMQIPNIPIEQVFKEVRRSVQAETKNQQTPWENTSLSGDFYFRVQR